MTIFEIIFIGSVLVISVLGWVTFWSPVNPFNTNKKQQTLKIINTLKARDLSITWITKTSYFGGGESYVLHLHAPDFGDAYMKVSNNGHKIFNRYQVVYGFDDDGIDDMSYYVNGKEVFSFLKKEYLKQRGW